MKTKTIQESTNKNKHLKFEEPNLFSQLTTGFLQVHDHRYYRRLLCLLIFIHMIISLLTTDSDLFISINDQITVLFQYAKTLWPFPTFTMNDNDQYLHINNIIYKVFEILVLLLYTLDLLPKIFVWNKPFYWKLINVFVVTIMVLQVPLTMIGQQESGISKDKLKFRICSLSLSFLLLCDIMSIREKKSIQQKFAKQAKMEKKVTFKEYTWAEIVKHDKPDDCWVVIHEKVYDLTNFVQIHPGGPMIYDGAGGDCTPMWHSYHGSQIVKQGVPEKYLIGQVKGYKDFYSYDGDFYSKLKEKVEKVIPKSKRQNDYWIFIKAIILLCAYLYSVYYYVKNCTFFSAVLFGLLSSQVDVNIMHDGNHVAFSSNKFISYLAGYTLDLTGSTSVVYRRSHNFGHHGCVNHIELDSSFQTTYPIMRLSKTQQKLWFHKYQHYYTWFMYGMVNFGDLFGTFDELFWLSNFPMRRGFLTKKSILLQCLCKLLWFIITLVIPSYSFGWYSVYPIWFAYMTIFSYGYALFFAVNHWTEEAMQVDNSNIGKTNWGILQIENSTNFAIDSFLWTNLSGGLNLQIEHHLFPGYAHTRLYEIKSIVQDMCKEYNLRYISYPSFFAAIKGHYNHLKNLAMSE